MNPILAENDDDDEPCACDNLWIISDEFVKRDITLVIIGLGPVVSICDGLYGSVARNTGRFIYIFSD